MLSLASLALAGLALAPTAHAFSEEVFHKVLIAHATLGTVAWAFLMPVAVILIRLIRARCSIWIHGGIMIFAYTLALACMGTGIWMALLVKKLDTAHAIIGLVVICSAIAQPITGLAHHLMYNKKGSPNGFTYPHVWWGRVIITLAIINGGLGLQLTGASGYQTASITRKYEIVYGVLAGFFWLLWMVVIAISFFISRRETEMHASEKVFITSQSSTDDTRRLGSNDTQFAGAAGRPSDAYRPSDVTASNAITARSGV